MTIPVEVIDWFVVSIAGIGVGIVGVGIRILTRIAVIETNVDWLMRYAQNGGRDPDAEK